ncbi:hypothetical protein I553_5875 [Mycobacterium xenopi 4042]|uniref:DUF4244 domain-containing protein n=1 Tax=Mycobacterium xenopi 4042 TaxID=1299334 RepID=X7ZX18_MYCXE|nr:hypothetical protein I553_5875 [Mycobacterium xenopi 4042]
MRKDNMFRALHARLVLLVVDESGMSTVEYAIGTIAAAAFGRSSTRSSPAIPS